MSILDQYNMEYPSVQNALDLFKGEWSSHLPIPYESGGAPLFNDSRIRIISDALGGYYGKRILELGPLEGAHSYMMQNSGAESVLSIEANSRAYLKCLIAKEILGMDRVRFLHGDFDKYLERSTVNFDMILACGVIYHCINPVKTIVEMTKKSSQIGIWTQYYIEDIVREKYGKKFNYKPQKKVYEDYSVDCYEHNYMEALEIEGFCGGGNASTFWMPLDGWKQLFNSLGWELQILTSSEDHPHGPEFTGVATKA